MLTCANFICQSLELHLFFARIMKEHAFFLEIGFSQKNVALIRQADCFRRDFDRFLAEVTSLANSIVRPEILKSGEVITPYTLPVEIASSHFTGIKIATALTKAEAGLEGGNCQEEDKALVQKVHALNKTAMSLITSFIKFKEEILAGIFCCKVFTFMYPLAVEHVIREAKLYLRTVKKIQSRQLPNLEKEIPEQQLFWNTLLHEHTKFIKVLLDPAETAFIEITADLECEFGKLVAKSHKTPVIPISQITKESLRLTKRISYFKTQGIEKILECQIKSIIIPLLADHTLREANHYLRILKMYRE